MAAPGRDTVMMTEAGQHLVERLDRGILLLLELLDQLLALWYAVLRRNALQSDLTTTAISLTAYRF